jgi:peptide/nickel transport system permease protein
MFRLIGRRILISIPLLFVVSMLTFVLERLAPGNAASAILGASGNPAEYAAIEKQLGENLPIWQQYWNWLSGVLHGNMGTSIVNGEAVTTAIANRLPVTLWLIVGSVLLAALLGMSVGVLVAVLGGRVGQGLDVFSLLCFSIPSFWLALLLVELFAVRFSIFPASGWVGPTTSVSGWLHSLALPVIALGIGGMAVVAKVTRDSMLDVLQRDFIRNLRANGVPAHSIVLKHGLKNAALPVITVLGLISVGLLGGTVAVESVFALPGMGSLAVSATTDHDTPTVQGVAVFFTLIVVGMNLVLDIAYGWLNPRVRTTR